MPIYEYECRRCGTFEYSQSITASPLRRCPKCRSAVRKLVSASSFLLKGGGWYSDGYQKKSQQSRHADGKGKASGEGAGGEGSAKKAKSQKKGSETSQSS